MNEIDINSKQREFWKGNFGAEYAERNFSLKNVNSSYEKETGVTVESIFQTFFKKINRDSKILELGCNVGLNLGILGDMGFNNLTGLEINSETIKLAKTRNPKITFINSSIEEYDSENEKFDLVFTAGVLIHINPKVLDLILNKIIKLTTRYIFGFEYFSEKLEEISYRGNENVCWKRNFPSAYNKLLPEIKTVKEQKFYYKNNSCDIAFLLEK